MTTTPDLFQQFIGRQALVEGRNLEIVDWLSHQNSFVYQDNALTPGTFQENQYGGAGRKVSETWTLHYLNDSRTDIHPVLQAFLSKGEIQSLRQDAVKNDHIR